MRKSAVFAILMFMASAVASAQDDDARARTLARDLLDRGATLFDTRNAAAMAATYIDAAEIILIKRASDSSRVAPETYRGRAAIEKAYADIFKDRLPEHRSRNTVEYARFLGPNLILIQGRFAMNREQGDTAQFVQVRVREGDQWKIVTLQLTPLPEKNP
jgi:hypothetical protein